MSYVILLESSPATNDQDHSAHSSKVGRCDQLHVPNVFHPLPTNLGPIFQRLLAFLDFLSLVIKPRLLRIRGHGIEKETGVCLKKLPQILETDDPSLGRDAASENCGRDPGLMGAIV